MSVSLCSFLLVPCSLRIQPHEIHTPFCQLTSCHMHEKSNFFSLCAFCLPNSILPGDLHLPAHTHTHVNTHSSTMASNVLMAKTDTQTILTISCFAPKVSGESTRLTLSINTSYLCSWACTLTNQTPQLDVSLVWTISQGYERHQPPPSGVQSLRIVSRNGTLVLSTPFNGITNGATMTGTSCAYLKVRVDDMSQRKYLSNVTLSSSSS